MDGGGEGDNERVLFVSSSPADFPVRVRETAYREVE